MPKRVREKEEEEKPRVPGKGSALKNPIKLRDENVYMRTYGMGHIYIPFILLCRSIRYINAILR
jgi:hypothetical protein